VIRHLLVCDDCGREVPAAAAACEMPPGWLQTDYLPGASEAEQYAAIRLGRNHTIHLCPRCQRERRAEASK
jgi:hypothetical protein